MALRHFTLSSSLCAETIGATWEVRSENNMERVRAMIAPPSYLYEVSSARAPEGFHSVKRSRKGRIFRWISLSKIRQVIKNRLLDIDKDPFVTVNVNCHLDSVSLPRRAAVSDGHHLRHDAQYRKQRHQSFAPSRSPRAHPLEGAPEQRAAADPQAGVPGLSTRPVPSNTCGDQPSITLSQFHSATPPPLEPEVHRG